MKKLTFPSLLILAIAGFSGLGAQTPLKVLKSFPIQSAGGWDYIAVGPGNGRLYISHGTHVNVLDLKTGDSLGIIENTPGVHGIAFDKEHNKGFTSNGRGNNVTVFDLGTNEWLGSIPTGQNPDAILFEPYSKKIITCNGRSRSLSILDPVENKLLDSIDVGGKPETAVSDGKGFLFVNIEDNSEIVKVNMRSLKVDAHWSIGDAKEPTGLAMDPATRRLFAGCGNKLLAILDADNGKLIQTLPIGDGCDGVAFDEGSKNIFTSNGEGTISAFHEKSANQYDALGTIITQRGARTICVDRFTHLLYLPAADFEPMAPGQKGRPAMIPGSFRVLVVGQ